MEFGKEISKKYAVKDRGISSSTLHNNFAAPGYESYPYIIEERPLNVASAGRI